MGGQVVRRMVNGALQKRLKKSLLSIVNSRAVHSSNSKGDPWHRIIKSPSLISLDVPDSWSTNAPSHFDFPSMQHSTQTARLIDGRSIAEEIRSEIATEVRRMKDSIGKVPGLGVILVGCRRDSQTYVRNKIKACEEVGINFVMTELPDSCTEVEVCDALSSFNANLSVHGILVELPLPEHLNEVKILDVLILEKDVDGFHPMNMGNLAMQGGEPLFIPCTPKGCIELLLRSDVKLEGKRAVVIGRSNIVGLPMSLLLQIKWGFVQIVGQRHHATVTVLHAFSQNPEQITREADIVITAVGTPNLVRGSWIKLGAVVIDVGTYPVEDSSSEHGYHLSGDVCLEEAVKVASAITPVPGGVGPMTIAMLLANTLESAKRAYNYT